MLRSVSKNQHFEMKKKTTKKTVLLENLQLVLLITGLRAEHDFPVQLSEDSFYYNGSITNCPFSRRPTDKELIRVHVHI